MDLIPVCLVMLPIVTALVIYVFKSNVINYAALIIQGPLVIAAIIQHLHLNEVIVHRVFLGGWPQHIGISLRNDQLSSSFILLAVIIWSAVLIYEWGKKKTDYNFLFFVLFLEGVFLGLLQTNDLFNFFVFVEIATVLSAVLITYNKQGYALKAGLYYILFNTTGILIFLTGLALLYSVTGTLNMEIASDKLQALDNSNLPSIIYVFLVVSMGVKSAFFPVYNWLPRAHGAAPTAISALLSGLLVKTGLYGFLRINQIFSIEAFLPLFLILGFTTAFAGILFAISQNDIKQILAFSTISQIGLILMGLSGPNELMFQGGVFHIINHALFKALLFLGAGVIIGVFGKQNVTKLRGVFKVLPLHAILMIIGMLSITGAPLFGGFISKTIIGYGLEEQSLLYTMYSIINIGTMTIFIKVSQIFFGSAKLETHKLTSEKFALGLLGIASLAIGLYYSHIANFLWNIKIDFLNIWSTEGWIYYIVNLIIAYTLYNLFIKNDFTIIKKIRAFELPYETANLMLIFFLFILLLVA